MSAPADRAITVEQGYGLTLPMIYKDSDGNPVNLSTWTARMQVRSTPTSSEVLYDLSAQIALGAAGEVTLTIDDDQAADMWLNGVYDLRLVPPAGNDVCLLKGKFYVEPRVTR